MDLQAMIQDILSGNTGEKISQKTGLGQDQLSQVISLGLPMILGGMAKNTTTQEGADSLDTALAHDHQQSLVLNDPEAATSDTAELDGTKILGHVFGDDRPAVSSAVSEKTGIDAAKIMQVLALLAPLVMAYLAKKKTQENLDAGGLSDILTKQTASDGTSLMDIVGSVIGMFSRSR